MAGVLSEYFRTIKEDIRNFTLDLLFKGVGYLSGHNFVHIQEDTAELVHDRRGLKISFVFGGQPHDIILPYNPYRIEKKEYVLYAEDDELPIANLRPGLPGLDESLFTKEVLSRIYARTITRVDSILGDD
jgi:hypothetical protein